jgi:hypothetical protein
MAQLTGRPINMGSAVRLRSSDFHKASSKYEEGTVWYLPL